MAQKINHLIRKSVWCKIANAKTIVIHRHVNPDPDAIGSQLGLKTALQSRFPDKHIYAVGEIAPGLTFMGEMDEISDDTYNTKIVDGVEETTLSLVLDTANIARISDSRFEFADFVVKIDHHPNREPFGDLVWVDTSYASTCEMIVDLLRIAVPSILPNESAKLLYTGFIGDSGRFLYPSTSSSTLEAAAYLKQFNFDAQEIYNNLYSVSLNTVKAKAHLLNEMKMTSNNVAYSNFTEEDLQRLGVRKDEAANLVNEMSYIDGVSIWVLFVQDGDNYRVRLRSSAPPIDKIANNFNGGGHPLASGATVNQEQINELLAQLNDSLK